MPVDLMPLAVSDDLAQAIRRSVAVLSPLPLPPEGDLSWQLSRKEFFMQKMNAKRLAVVAMFAAMCTVLGMLALDFISMKITFESLPILIGALLFGPVDGVAIGLVGTLIYQLLRYGVSATTLLWMLPYGICGLLVGLYAARRKFDLTRGQLMGITVANELLITALNTGVICVDSIIYGYYSKTVVFGMLIPRIALSIGKGVVFAVVLPYLLKAARRALRMESPGEQA